jgi:hypothetical protein
LIDLFESVQFGVGLLPGPGAGRGHWSKIRFWKPAEWPPIGACFVDQFPRGNPDRHAGVVDLVDALDQERRASTKRSFFAVK